MMVHLLQYACAVVALSMPVSARIRQYYIGAVEEVWDYAPGGGDLFTFESSSGYSDMNQESIWRTFLEPGPQRIGGKYLKAMYRQFTDATFTHRVPRPEWMGFLGPILSGEQGDIIRIVFKNMAYQAGRNFSMHPHGAQYTKENEGALYVDGTSGADKLDEQVAPGQTYTYEWLVMNTSSPTPDDPECLTWVYHSHVDTAKDTNSGLIGVLLTCKPGGLARISQNFQEQMAMLLFVSDENDSWYIDINIQHANLVPTQSQTLEDLKNDEDFKFSNLMHGMNGRVFAHLGGLDVCVGDKILWHLIGFGNEIDIHTFRISGHSFLYNKHRVDAIDLNPVDLVTATMEVQTPGRWLVSCNTLSHIKGGMVAIMNAENCSSPGGKSYVPPFQSQRIRHHYIGIENVKWDYGPTGQNLFDGGNLVEPNSPSEKFFRADGTRVGGVYTKALYREYEDVTFTKQKTRGEEEEHLGFLGPVLRVEVGDTLVLTLKNNANMPFSIHPHGASFIKFGEGALYNDSTSGMYHSDDFVRPGVVITTYWYIPESMGPGPEDPPCILRLYTSSSRDVRRDAYTGLVGPMLICRQGALDEHDRQRQVDREFFLMMSVTDENLSWYRDLNFRNLHVDVNSPGFVLSNKMFGFNGYVFGNLPGLNMCLGDRVAWHVFSVGSEKDIHTVYFHGQPLTLMDTHRSSSFVLPGYFRTLLMKVQNPGQWALVCQTNNHFNNGMKELFNVNKCGLNRDFTVEFQRGGKQRVYYIQAEEELWDYAPSGLNRISGVPLAQPGNADYIFTRSDGPYLGKVYKKARYHQYTDGTFTTEITRNASDAYLGILGPLIVAEAYDTILVQFRNKASRPYSMHAQGLFYEKDSEGAMYVASNGAVQPGETVWYKWTVPADFAPAEGDPSCINQAYYSAIDPAKDTNSGLIGPLVVCKPGALQGSNSRQDVDASFVLLFEVIDENESWYLNDNIRMFGNSASKSTPGFKESNLMHAINGYIYGNNPTMAIPLNSVTDWHLMALGGVVDIHSVHFHGNDVIKFQNGRHNRDVIQLFPGIFETVRMNATMPGQWLLHCHVHDHLVAGMETTYTVFEQGGSTFTQARPTPPVFTQDWHTFTQQWPTLVQRRPIFTRERPTFIQEVPTTRTTPRATRKPNRSYYYWKRPHVRG